MRGDVIVKYKINKIRRVKNKREIVRNMWLIWHNKSVVKINVALQF